MVMKRAPYPSDLTTRQWQLIEPLLPPPKPGGRAREVDLREVVNGICYMSRSGCAWRMLPHDSVFVKIVVVFFYSVCGRPGTLSSTSAAGLSLGCLKTPSLGQIHCPFFGP